MEKNDKYEYHKQNDYPGERVAEKKRVADRKEVADNKADARVAAKGRNDELKADNLAAAKGRNDERLMNSERKRSAEKAGRINRKRNATDSIGLMLIGGLIIILLIGFIWGFMFMQKQSDQIDAQSKEIDSLRWNLAKEGLVQYNYVPVSNEAKQNQLYRDFVIMTNDVKKEIADLKDYNMVYTDMYQLCYAYTEQEKDINDALYRFAEKQIVYYNRIADLADKSECKVKIELMRLNMESSKFADEKLYVLTKKLCTEMTDKDNERNTELKNDREAAREEATIKADAFDDAEESVVECFA